MFFQFFPLISLLDSFSSTYIWLRRYSSSQVLFLSLSLSRFLTFSHFISLINSLPFTFLSHSWRDSKGSVPGQDAASIVVIVEVVVVVLVVVVVVVLVVVVLVVVIEVEISGDSGGDSTEKYDDSSTHGDNRDGEIGGG